MKLKALTAALAVSAFSTISSQVQAAENILFNCFFPPQHYVCTQFLPEMAKRVDEATESRVKIRIPPKSLTAPPDVYDGVVNGVMDGGIQFNAFLAGQVPGIQFSLLPFVGYENAEASSVALWRTYQKFFGEKDEYGEAVLLAVYATNGAEIFSMSDKPIESVDDIANRKMWGLPGTVATTLKGTGTSVVAGPAVQMLEIISKGVVDGYAGVPFTSVLQFKLTDYTKSATVFDKKIFQPTFSFFVSKKKWNAISPEDQEAIRNALGEGYSKFTGNVQDGFQAKAKEALTDLPKVEGSAEFLAALQKLGQPLVDAWVEKAKTMGVDGNEVLAFYDAAYKEELAKIGN